MRKHMGKMEKAKRYIKEHYHESTLSEEEVSAAIGMTPICFSNMFRKKAGQTYVSYVRRVRMEAAAKLLRETDQKTCVIAKKVGIEDANYFSVLFKKQYGIAPSVYREKKVLVCVAQKVDDKEMLVSQALEYLKENYQDPELSAKTVSEKLNISRVYFSSIFRKVTGRTYVDCLKEIRMKAAAELLEQTQEKTWVIGQSVGFEDGNYFSIVFKKYYGISPSEYRQTEHNSKMEREKN